MSIRRRLFFSNAAMILFPVVIIIILLNLVLGGQYRSWGQQLAQESDVVSKLIRLSSLEQDKLSNQEYMDNISKQTDMATIDIIVLKNQELLYPTDTTDDISIEDLPRFGNEGYDPVAWLEGNQYAVHQHDFYFDDGSKGSILLLNSERSFVRSARAFFPIIFLSLILLLIITNVLLSYYTSKSILQPIKQLSQASAKIKQGSLDFSLKPRSKDELGRLVHSFDEMREQLKESIKLRDQYENNRKRLLANISHDLKTPMTSILGYVEGIQVGVADTPDKERIYLEIISTKANYMNRLIEELFLYSKLDLNKLPFLFDEVNIIEFIKDYFDDIQDSLEEDNIQVTLTADVINSSIKVDRDKLIRVMENIISNSLKHLKNDQNHLKVSIKNHPRQIEIVVTDNGPGVREERLEDIFSSFYQWESSRHIDGSGLGLSIAAQIIEAHGGKIWAENVPEGGLSIKFTLQKFMESGD
ncbi:HAMP domain-containing sensor histidine kinase [Anaerobacillus sp. 1_MG-2023]|uniref:HAMP domain-containing sensor histidine kinase n=1 Tax=Anaerobacillus sp. 1_MG-2023 TaxID=3062655 RepID=UPI0026E3DEC9|nr:HAMP domain-containing sensor histidine kinase [Anaerobacillus sp. 1_MG-2023]MDO6655483.1 HAMP domain-containing sensor histidine kinase [Anaerobacillus sp. 1_MG-2023]